MSAIRLLAFDLDGTILDANHRIPPANREAIDRLRSAGVICVPASGRMHQSTRMAVAELDLHSPVISYNGAMVRSADDDVWLHRRLPAQLAAVVIEHCARFGRHLNCYVDDHLYVSEIGDWARFYLRQTRSPMEAIGDLSALIGRDHTKLILIDSPEVTLELEPLFRDIMGSDAYIVRTNPEYLEFMHPDANKGHALRVVADRLGIPMSQAAAIGDGANDAPMIASAAIGIALGPDAAADACHMPPTGAADAFALAVDRWVLAEN